MQAGRVDEALALYSALAREYPRSESPHLAAGNALIAAGRLVEATRELEAAGRLAPKPAAILDGLARLYLDPKVRRPADALTATRAATRLEPWREDSYYLRARAYEGLGDHEGARRAYAALVQAFPAGAYRDRADRGLDRLSQAYYEVSLGFRFANRGHARAENVRLRVQAAGDFAPYSESRLVKLPSEARGHALEDGTRYFTIEPFALGPGEERSFELRYLVSVSARSYVPLQVAVEPTAGETDSPERYLAASPFIESDAPEIVSLARTLTADTGATSERARLFYNFVGKRLSYVVQSETKGALGALADPDQTDCTEFAALFIALNRAAGIPARPVFGYLFEAGKSSYDISHLWAEFWDDELGWVSADPTNGTLEPHRYFGRAESTYIPLWVPSSRFGDLAGVRVSYQSPSDGDTLSTALVTRIRRIAASDFETAATTDVTFAPATPGDVDDRGGGPPLAPTLAATAAALAIGLWQRRARAA